MEKAANLKGKLMLITGDVDDNVHPAGTYRMVDALIKANKRFDMMVFPGKDHAMGGAYYVNLIHDYFTDHLK
jgi:dipeptidyl aminopeptidase/acylaminoacyl peptidase